VLAVLEVRGGRLVQQHGGALVELQHRRRAGGADRPLDRAGDRPGLGVAGGHHQQLPRLEDRAEALRDDVQGHLGHGAEEPRVVLAGARGERLGPGPRRQRRARFVERQVAVRADAQDLHVDAAGRGDRGLVAAALGRQVRRVAVRPVQGVVRQVDAGGEVPADDGGVALRVVGREADVVVEEERAGRRERQPRLAVPAGELAVERHRA
jgi:hypothetical protein